MSLAISLSLNTMHWTAPCRYKRGYYSFMRTSWWKVSFCSIVMCLFGVILVLSFSCSVLWIFQSCIGLWTSEYWQKRTCGPFLWETNWHRSQINGTVLSPKRIFSCLVVFDSCNVNAAKRYDYAWTASARSRRISIHCINGSLLFQNRSSAEASDMALSDLQWLWIWNYPCSYKRSSQCSSKALSFKIISIANDLIKHLFFRDTCTETIGKISEL